MTAPFWRFPDVQVALVADLEAIVGAGHTGIRTPKNLEEVLPFARIMRFGGASDQLNDHARVEIDVFAATYAEAEELAERIRERMVGPPPAVRVFDRVDCMTAPRELPWGEEDGDVRRFGAEYAITARRRLSS